MRLRIPLAILSLVLMSAACKREIDPEFRVPSPLVEPLPFKVGVYYGEELLNAHIGNKTSAEFDFMILAGRANVSLYNQLFSVVFLEAIPQKSRVAESVAGEQLDAIIELEILTFAYDWDVYSGAGSVVISYVYTLYSPGGQQLGQWSVKGHGSSSGGLGLMVNVLHDSTEAAMRDAAAKLVVAMYRDPSIRRCLERSQNPIGLSSDIKECLSE